MPEEQRKESPLVCDLTAMSSEQRERHQQVGGRMLSSVQEVRELPEGYAFRFPADNAMLMTVAEFTALERLCCPFLDFTIDLEREGGPLWLTMSGREGVKEFLKIELADALPASR